jgi:glycerol-3-phosphate O-acyltransferase
VSTPAIETQAPAKASALADSPALRRALGALALATGRGEQEVLQLARAYLEELGTRHVPRIHSLWVRAGRALIGAGYSGIDYDPAQLARVRDLLSTAPTAVLSSHRSYLDGGALTVGFHDHGLPPLTVFGGINMAFWPIGPLWRRNGMVFIRRGETDPVYRCTLRHWLAHLVDQRRPLQWFIEGTRSRTGKLGPPRLGLLAYLADAWRDGDLDDLHLLPVAVAYDQLQEVAEYAGEARGAAKAAESLGWLVRFVRAQRGRFGRVYVRFGEPVSLRAALGSAADARPHPPGERRLELQKLAFEVACRINDATPITGASLATLALLGARGRALTLAQMRKAVEGYLDFAARRSLPLAPTARLDSDAALAVVLDGLVGQGVVEAHRDGREAVFGIAPGQHLAAAFYRNTIAHFFLHGAIAEIALLGAAARPAGQRSQAFGPAALELRDLLKFDFYFRDREPYLESVHAELDRMAPGWRMRLEDGPEGVQALLAVLPTLGSDMLLRPFFEAYAIVADVLAAHGDEAAPEPRGLIEECMGLGRQYELQRRLAHPESVSRHLFATGLDLARHRGLCEAGATAQARTAFAAGLHAVLKRLDMVHAVAVRRVEAALVTAAPSSQA